MLLYRRVKEQIITMPNAKQLAWLNSVAPMAVASARKLGMPDAFATVSTVQAILESGWGQYESGTDNDFGIKADGFNSKGSTVVTTHETIGGKDTVQNLAFQNYASYEEAFSDHARIFLTGALAPKYKAWLADGGKDPANLIMRVAYPSQPPLYATAQNYVATFRSILAMKDVSAAITAALAQ